MILVLHRDVNFNILLNTNFYKGTSLLKLLNSYSTKIFREEAYKERNMYYNKEWYQCNNQISGFDIRFTE